MSEGLYLSEKEMLSKAVEIVRIMDGIPTSQVEPLLREARDIALASGVVQVAGERFTAIVREPQPASL